MGVDITETMWRRGWEDAKRGWTDWRFVVADMVALPLLAYFVSLPVALGMAALSLFAVWVGATASAPIRQRNEARLALANRETPFAIAERPPLHVSPKGAMQIFTPININCSGSEKAQIERLAAFVEFGFRGEGTGWSTRPDAAIAVPMPFSTEPAPLLWEVREDRTWEVSGLPVVIRPGGRLSLPKIGVEIVDELKVREVYKHPEGAFIQLELSIHSSAGANRISHTIPVVFSDADGVDFGQKENA